MQYTQKLSEKALDCLAILEQPTWKEIWKQRTEDFLGSVGTRFDKILNEMNISMNALRRLLQRELYGIAGVFFQTLTVSHSVSLVSKDLDGDFWKLIKEGYEPRWSCKGELYQAKPKKNHPRQVGLYIPESIQKNFEESVDNEDRLFTKDFDSDSLEVLEYIFIRSLELRKRYGDNWYPRFSDKSISGATGIQYEHVKHSTSDLVGIICESYRMKDCRVWQKLYFLPSSKFSDVEDFLA